MIRKLFARHTVKSLRAEKVFVTIAIPVWLLAV
jgi:hypothetical protein